MNLKSVLLAILLLITLLPKVMAQSVIWEDVDSIRTGGGAYSVIINDLRCLNADTCFVVGREGFALPSIVYRTVDGGESWQRMLRADALFFDSSASLADDEPVFTNVRFLYDTILLSTDSGHIVRSIDRGASWEVRRVPGPRPLLRLSIDESGYGSGAFGYIEGDSTVLLWTTANGGVAWKRHDLDPPPGWSFGIVEGVETIAARTHVLLWRTLGRDMIVARSSDDGMSWDYHPVLGTGDSVRPGNFLFGDSLHGWITGGVRQRNAFYHTYIFQTDDGGRTWRTAFDSAVTSLNLGVGLGKASVNATGDTLLIEEIGSGAFARIALPEYTLAIEPIPEFGGLSGHVAYPEGSWGLAVDGFGRVYKPTLISDVPRPGEEVGPVRTDRLLVAPNIIRSGNDLLSLTLPSIPAGPIDIEVVDLFGRILLMEHDPGTIEGPILLRLPTEAMCAGRYILRVRQEGVASSSAVIVLP